MDPPGNQGHTLKRIIVIPARYASKRLPGKPLLTVKGKTLIEYVYRNALRSKKADSVVVATDDERIFNAVMGFGGNAVITTGNHPSGTDRVAEVALSLDADCIINIQGDEPNIPIDIIDRMFAVLQGGAVEVVTAARKLRTEKEMFDRSRVKVVCDGKGRALLFTRAAVPHSRDSADKRKAFENALVHIGVYGFRRDVLLKYPALDIPVIEEIEKLEQLRLLFHGFSIMVLQCEDYGDTIDTPEDFRKFADSLG